MVQWLPFFPVSLSFTLSCLWTYTLISMAHIPCIFWVVQPHIFIPPWCATAFSVMSPLISLAPWSSGLVAICSHFIPRRTMSSIKSARWRNWHRTGSARGSDRECIYSYVSLYFSAYYGIKPRKKKGLRLWHQQRGFPNDRQFAACNTHISGLAQYARSYTLLRNVHSMWSDKKTWSSVGLGRAWIVFWDDKISLKLAWERTFEALKMMFVIERHNHAQTGIQTSVFFILPMYMCFFTSLWLFSNRIVRPFGRGGHFRFRAAVNYFFFFDFVQLKQPGGHESARLYLIMIRIKSRILSMHEHIYSVVYFYIM